MTPGRVLVAAACLAAGPLAAQVPAGKPALRKPTLYEDLQMFSQVLNQIRVNHLDSVDTHALIMAAVEGMVHAADPHSYVLPVARLSPEKARALGWEPQVRFDEGIERTVDWYRENEAWWEPIRSGEYRAYYEKQYGKSLG